MSTAKGLIPARHVGLNFFLLTLNSIPEPAGQVLISRSIAKDVFEKMFASGRTADDIVRGEGLTQVDDESHLAALIAGVLAKNADAVLMYQGGKATTFGFLVGQVMKAAGGQANPKRVNELLKKALDVLH